MKNKYLWVGALVLVVILVILGWVKARQNKNQLANNAISQQASSASSQASNASSQNASDKNAPPPTTTYTKLVEQYGSYRIQFDSMCQAHPNNVVFKNGTTIMLDNRADTSRVIKFNNISYYLGAYGYKLVTLSYKTLPATILVDCANYQNVAQITVEK